MGQSRTTEEAKQFRIEKLGREFGTFYHSLVNELYGLQTNWNEYRELFGENEERVKLLNKTAPLSFYVIQNVLWENLMLGISKITDPPKSAGEKNLTIQSIPYFVSDNALKTHLSNLISEIKEASKFCRDWRNRYIAHNDFNLKVGNQNALPLETASRTKFKVVLKKIHEFINLIESHYFDQEIYFEFLRNDRGALFLLRTLEDGWKYRNEEKESGNF